MSASDGPGEDRPSWPSRPPLLPRAVVTLPDTGDAPTGPQGEPLLSVTILGAPMRVWERSRIHTAELVREFSLLTIGRASSATAAGGGSAAGGAGGSDGRQGSGAEEPGGAADLAAVPGRLVQLAGDLQARYAGITEAQEDELEGALAAGELTRDVTYRVPAAVAQACQQLLDLLEEADAYCEHGDLLTLVSPHDQREFRRWYLSEFIGQVGGAAPRRWHGPTA